MNRTQLLELNHEILTAESDLKMAQFIRKAATILLCISLFLIPGIYVATVITWRDFDMAPIMVPAGLIVCITALLVAISWLETAVSPESRQLELRKLEERRRIEFGEAISVRGEARNVYVHSADSQVNEYRKGNSRYRRVHNLFQAVIIVGSLATSTLSGVAIEVEEVRWAAAACGFLVGIAAGFTGYYKFRERSFYLQQAADQVELETSAFLLGIGKYRDRTDDDALIEFVEEVERIKFEQRKREQNLEQSPERAQKGQ